MPGVTRTDRAHAAGKIIPSSRVRMEEPASAPEPASPPHAHDEPKITLVKNGATVTAIVIECSCGQKTRLECQY